MLWANLHLLFWLSLFPVTTAWIGENPLAAAPAVLYGAVLLMAAIAYWILQQLIIAAQGPDSLPKKAVGTLVALLWLVPDRRIENVLVRERRPAK
jgi:uncharacterized membrane protein